MIIIVALLAVLMMFIIAVTTTNPRYEHLFAFIPLLYIFLVIFSLFSIKQVSLNNKIDYIGKNIVGIDNNNIYYANEDDILSYKSFKVIYTELDEPEIVVDKTSKYVYNITVKWPLSTYKYYDNPKVTILSNDYIDMSIYKKYDKNINSRFIDSSVKKIKAKMNKNESFIAYFGFSECPHCNEIINTVAENANTYNQDIFYVDTRKNASWKSNLDIDNYDMLVDLLGDYLEYDENNIKHLYVPTIIFINNGEIKSVVALAKDDKTVSDEFIEKLNTEFSLVGGEQYGT